MSESWLWTFKAVDTWFFRESRPMEAVGGAQLQSVFPPPARTLVGAIRTAIGDAAGVDWKAYGADSDHPLRAVIGDSDSLGPLQFTGPVIVRGGVRLYPAPLALLAGPAGADKQRKFVRLTPSASPVKCDIGMVRLPVKSAPLDGAAPLEGYWLTDEGMNEFLRGTVPSGGHLVAESDLFRPEERLGIGRDVHAGSVQEGMLYQTRHVRPREDVAIGMSIRGLRQGVVPGCGISRLGAEGRLGAWTCDRHTHHPIQSRISARLLLVLLTPALFLRGWVPDGLESITTANGEQVWEGQLAGVPLRLVCAVIGKAQREGGWDMVHAAPRAVENLVPAGSCYFFECLDDAANLIGLLAGLQIGQDTQWGRGEVAVGTW